MAQLSRRMLLSGGLVSVASIALVAACGGAAPSPTTAPPKPADAAKPADKPAEASKPVEAAKPAAGGSAKPVIQLWDTNTDWKKMPGYWSEQSAQKFPAAD